MSITMTLYKQHNDRFGYTIDVYNRQHSIFVMFANSHLYSCVVLWNFLLHLSLFKKKYFAIKYLKILILTSLSLAPDNCTL
jgi:hypothetical protein